MSRFIEHSMNLDTIKHSQDDLHFRTEGVYSIKNKNNKIDLKWWPMTSAISVASHEIKDDLTGVNKMGQPSVKILKYL